MHRCILIRGLLSDELDYFFKILVRFSCLNLVEYSDIELAFCYLIG